MQGVPRSKNGRVVGVLTVAALGAMMLPLPARSQSIPKSSPAASTLQAASLVAATPLSPFARRKAEVLLRDKLGCLGCHQLGRDGGRLAPALDGVHTRRSAAYIDAIIRDPQRVVPETIMPKALWSASERDLIIRYFGGAPGAIGAAAVTATRDNAPPKVPSTGTAMSDTTPVASAARYVRSCAGCHGVAGKGDGVNAPYLPVAAARHADATAMSLRTDDSLFDTVFGGGAIMNRSARMPAFGGTMSSAEIRGLVRHMRTLCQCQGPAWSRDGAP